MKIAQLFDVYGEYYQPYIPPVMEALQRVSNIQLDIVCFKGDSMNKDLVVLPSYRHRIIREKVNKLFKRSKLNYFEIWSLEQGMDIIHIQHSYIHPKIENLLKIKNRPKIVITLRGSDTYIKPWISDKWREFYKGYGQHIEAFVVMSMHQKNYLQKWGVKEEKIHIIPISFGDKSRAKPKYLNKGRIKIISAFRMCWEKNIEGNLRTAKLLKEKGVNFQYDIYGDGPDSGQVYYLIDKYNLQDYCFYHGRISNVEFKSQLVYYDFFLQLSHSESLGMSIIEAQSKGVPCIVSNSDGLPEVIINDKTGFLMDPDNSLLASEKIKELAMDNELYFSFSNNAIDFVNSNFTINHEVQSLLQLYKSLM